MGRGHLRRRVATADSSYELTDSPIRICDIPVIGRGASSRPSPPEIARSDCQVAGYGPGLGCRGHAVPLSKAERGSCRGLARQSKLTVDSRQLTVVRRRVVQRFTELQIWQRSHQLALEVYKLTSTFPRSEQFGIVSQVRRAVVSVSSNISEGAKRASQLDYARFLNMAESSLAETESLLRLARDLEFAPAAIADRLIDESEQVSRMIQRCVNSLEEKEPIQSVTVNGELSTVNCRRSL